MANKKDTQPRPVFRSKSAAERMLDNSLSPVANEPQQIVTQEPRKQVTQQNTKKELKRATGYFRPEQVRFMREYCESLRKKFNNENIKPPLLQRILLDIWDESTARKVEKFLREQGYDKSED